MRREWDPEDLIACWTMVDDHWRLLANKRGPSRLAFALLLKFFELEGRLPRHPGEFPGQAVAYVAEQVRVDPGALIGDGWCGRTAAYHRTQIRTALGFRECTVDDEQRLTAWLADEVCRLELAEDRQREALLARCRAERLEPPVPGQIDRVLAAAGATAD